MSLPVKHGASKQDPAARSMTAEPLFGTDGIRGAAGVFPMTVEVADALGRAVVAALSKDTSGVVIIGRDTRISSPVFEQAVAQGVTAAGGEVWRAGVLPTPALAYVVERHAAAAGIMISASHNPAADNGLKVLRAGGRKCTDAEEARLEKALREAFRPSAGSALSAAPRDPAGIVRDDLRRDYEHYIRDCFARELDLKGRRIVVDAAHGAAWQTTPSALRALGAEVVSFYDHPDGNNINDGCGSTFPQAIEALVREHRGDVGIAHDGDADRVILCDETGRALDGDEVLAILALDALERGTLAHQTLVATVMSNLGLEEALGARGASVVRVPVGDRFVAEAMEQGGFTLGGEQSGHIIVRPFQQTGDGLVAALSVLCAMQRAGKPLSELRQCLHLYPQRLFNLPVKEKRPLEGWAQVQSALAEAEAALQGRGRLLLRYSGTEPKIRLLVEAREGETIEAVAEKILAPIRSAIGV